MRAKRAIVWTALTLALLLACASPVVAAPGDTIHEGETEQGVKVKLTVASAGNATVFRIGKSKVKCERGGTLKNERRAYEGFDTSDPGEFSDARSEWTSSDPYRFKTKTKLAGQVGSDGSSWHGTVKLKTRVFKHDRQIDTCRLKSSWGVS